MHLNVTMINITFCIDSPCVGIYDKPSIVDNDYHLHVVEMAVPSSIKKVFVIARNRIIYSVKHINTYILKKGCLD